MTLFPDKPNTSSGTYTLRLLQLYTIWVFTGYMPTCSGKKSVIAAQLKSNCKKTVFQHLFMLASSCFNSTFTAFFSPPLETKSRVFQCLIKCDTMQLRTPTYEKRNLARFPANMRGNCFLYLFKRLSIIDAVNWYSWLTDASASGRNKAVEWSGW